MQPCEVRTTGAVAPVPVAGSIASVPRLPGGGSAAEAGAEVTSATTTQAAAAAEPTTAAS
ncbi:hypothetical protein [Amycolatopsis sp. CA-126428]|uniref:hypothetical protein n=1 Tax=Amycolatopsis sp. CA-126428 TaxID=2073158 RepID=UPI0018EDBCC4|nr:hypothetical protein [Amycolatopsis sp. CA-126428]